MSGRGGSYRDQRRKNDERAADSLKDEQAEKLFFGTSPEERKGLRKTPETKSVDVNKLDLNVLDRERFKAPEKVGENLRLIDMAMGQEPPPPPDLLAPKEEQAAPTKRYTRETPRPPSFRARIRRMSGQFVAVADKPLMSVKRAETPSDGVAITGIRRWPAAGGWVWLFRLLTLALAGVGLGAQFSLFPWPGALPFSFAPELVLVTALFSCWLTVGVRRFAAPRGSFTRELVRAGLIASLPALLGVAASWWLLGIEPFLPELLPLPPEVWRQDVHDLLRPLGRALGQPTRAVGAGLLVGFCYLLSLGLRLLLGGKA